MRLKSNGGTPLPSVYCRDQIDEGDPQQINPIYSDSGILGLDKTVFFNDVLRGDMEIVDT
jgi:hypothetical protein